LEAQALLFFFFAFFIFVSYGRSTNGRVSTIAVKIQTQNFFLENLRTIALRIQTEDFFLENLRILGFPREIREGERI
jgi:hypothetical protein